MKVIKPVSINYPDGSFLRGSTATYWDSTGTLQTAVVDVPRFTYDPYTKNFEGILLENTSTNLFTNSEFNTGTSGAVGLISISSMTNFISAVDYGHDGVTTSYFYKDSVLASIQYTISVFIKISDGSPPSFGSSTTSSALNDFILVLSGVAINPLTYNIKRISTNIYRVSASAMSSTTNLGNNGIVKYNTNSSKTFTTTGWQLEQGDLVTSYIPTTSTTATRYSDIISGSGLIYTNASESYPQWNAGTTYNIGDIVVYFGKLWESLQASNTSLPPNNNPTWWLELGPDNKHACFDQSVSTITSASSELIFCVKPGAIDSVALINAETAIVEITIVDPVEGITYQSTSGLNASEVYDWYQYLFYDPLIKRTQIIFSSIPKYANSIITIKLKNTGQTVSVAQAIFGTISTLGATQYGVNTGIIDYSKKETDEFGNTSFIKRAFSKRLSAQLHLENSDLNRVQNYLYNVRATPLVWIASDDPTYEEALIIYGFYRDFSTDIAYPSHSLCSLEIEGLS